MALIPERDRVRTDEDCFNIEIGFFYGVIGVEAESLLNSLLFLPISTGTGLIKTFEFLLLRDKVDRLSTCSSCLVGDFAGDFALPPPQLISLLLLMTSGGCLAEF